MAKEMICSVISNVVPVGTSNGFKVFLNEVSEFLDMLTYYSGLDVRYILTAVLICGSFYLICKLIITTFSF